MKRQIVILVVTYLIVMMLGFVWCYHYIDFKIIYSDLLFYSIISASLSYCGFLLLKILDSINLLKKLMEKIKFIMTYIIYIYMTIFLLESLIGLVMVFVFKNYIYSYSFFSILTILHATKLSKNIIEQCNTY